ncbi:hypothetical protein AL515_04395 [Citrobacter sp. FDAARGOS_156]|nr:hypothetical protein AL515_04395 [Citrobacter sp. FDAARGOS_156]AYL64186.1 hypothetical protein CUC49_22495 [Citrobacter pasteurii]
MVHFFARENKLFLIDIYQFSLRNYAAKNAISIDGNIILRRVQTGKIVSENQREVIRGPEWPTL